MAWRPGVRPGGAWSYLGRGRLPRRACYVGWVLCAHFSMFLRDSSSKALEFRTRHTCPPPPRHRYCATKKRTRDWWLSLLKKRKRKPFFVAERTRNHP